MIFLIITAAAAALAGVAPHAANPALGHWLTKTRDATIEIYTCGTKGTSICGRLLDSDGIRQNPQLRDIHNPDQTQSHRLLKNMVILWGFRLVGTSWKDGLVYDADDGGMYHATITPVGANQLDLRGCIIWPLCKTQSWKRVP